jgi:kynurenine formamidase
VIVDLPDAKKFRSTALTREHLEEWEIVHGRIPSGAYVILRTGWADYFKQPDKFLGNFADDSRQVFPGSHNSV